MDWKNRLKEKAVLVADGGWGTELQKAGLSSGDPPELWNVENAQAVEAVARGYVDAGADIILTNTFGGSRLKLEKAGLGERVAELNRVGTEISRSSAGEKALVFASVGPTGEFMAPLGTTTEDEMVAAFADQIAACVDAGADGIVIESMSDLGEAAAALQAARQFCSLAVVVCLTFNPGPKGFATMMGVRPEQAAAHFSDMGADIVGANCGCGIENMIEIASAMRPAASKPLWVKSNAGVPELVDGKTVFRDTPESMAASVRPLIEQGANIIGGCCGTTPEHIRQIAAAVAEHRDLARSVNSDLLADL